MGLFRRMADIVSANLNEMVDAFEDPETMLNQAVREMEAALRAALDGAARVIANEKLLARQLAAHRQQVEAWHAQAQQAVRRGDDEAARHALARQSEHETLVAALEDQWAAARTSGRRLKRQIDAMRVRLAEARRRLTTLAARRQAAEAQRRLAVGFSDAGLDTTAFTRFDRMSDRVERAEAEAEALLELAGGPWPEEPPTVSPEIEARLQALKQECTAADA